MAEYIDRETVTKSLEKLCDRVCQYSKAQRHVMCSSCPLGDAFIVIEDDIPPADIRPVMHGRWVKDSDGIYICSECGEVALQRVFIKLPKKIVDLQMVQSAFCPNCGAKMQDEAREGGRTD